MSFFANFAADDIADAAEKFIGKMDEAELASAVSMSERAMPPNARALFIDAILDAFRHRGESSDDVAEAAGTTVEAIGGGDRDAMDALLAYARSNAGLLREATTAFVEEHPHMIDSLAAPLRAGIAERLQAAHE